MTAERIDRARQALMARAADLFDSSAQTVWSPIIADPHKAVALVEERDALTARVTDLERENEKMKTTYLQPTHGWVCFHCGETFTKPGEARYHFGETPHGAPGCVIKVGEERGLLMALRKVEAELAAARKVEDGEVATMVKSLRYLAQDDVADLLTRLSAALKEAEEKFQCELRRANDYQDNLHRVGDQAKDLYARAQAAEAELESAQAAMLALHPTARIWSDGFLPHFEVGQAEFDALARALQTKDTTP